MILDTLKNSAAYISVHPRFEKAFEFLHSVNLQELPIGKTELEGADLVVNVIDITGKTTETAKMETHKNFIDIQVPVGAVETMGWKDASKLEQPIAPYNPEKDLTLFEDKASSFVNVQPFEFAIFFPEDGHQPGIGEGTYKKIIVKVRV